MRWLDSMLGRPRQPAGRTPTNPKSTANLQVEPLEERSLLSVSGAAFAAQAFQDLLGRPATPDQAAQLGGAGMPGDAVRIAIADGIINTTEFRGLVVNSLYINYLNRNVDAPSLPPLVNALAAGATVQQVSAALIASDEFFAQNGSTNAGFVNGLFQDALDRPADPQAIAVFGGLLDQGTSRFQLASLVLQSYEFQFRLVNDLYLNYLGRPVDVQGANFQVARLAAGVRPELLIGQLVGSVEYLNQVVPGVTSADSTLTTNEVDAILRRAVAASGSNDAIVAIMDRGGRILGVRVEEGAAANLGVTFQDLGGGRTIVQGPQANKDLLTFAIDGALAKARTAAFFANNQAPLTSRTVQFISQSTMTEREIDSNPNITDPNSTERGPGFVAAVSIRGHFPPNVSFTPQVDLFQIEHTNRDSIINAGPNRVRQGGLGDDIYLPNLGRGRFNIPLNELGAQLATPDSIGVFNGITPQGQGRGVGTLPGGIPIYRNGVLLGGIGVFFPGRTGFASEENSSLDVRHDPTRVDRSMEAEFIAVAAVGGSRGAGVTVGALGSEPALPTSFDIPFGRLDLVGITLDVVGPLGNNGPEELVRFSRGLNVGAGNVGASRLVPIDLGADNIANNANVDLATSFLRAGQVVAEGWLVVPKAGVLANGIQVTAADVQQIILNGVAQAQNTKAAIRLPVSSATSMVLAVTDINGEVLGLFRMTDSTIFSIDVAVAKARNVNYYAGPNLQLLDRLDRAAPNGLLGLPLGTALTNRTFRYLGEPRFPEGIDGATPGPFSQLLDGGANPLTGRQVGGRLPASAFQTVVGFDAFNPGTNFHEPFSLNQNGIVFFPGSTPIYKTVNGIPILAGGFGVSGDGVDQDDVVTAAGAQGFGAPGDVRADQFRVRNVRLPFQKFLRNPTGI